MIKGKTSSGFEFEIAKARLENYELIESVKDLNGNDRVVVCRFLQK